MFWGEVWEEGHIVKRTWAVPTLFDGNRKKTQRCVSRKRRGFGESGRGVNVANMHL